MDTVWGTVWKQNRPSSLAFCCFDKHHDQKQLGQDKGFFHCKVYSPSWKKVRAGTQRSMLTYLSYTSQDHLHLVILPTVGMAVPHQSFQKCPHRLVCRLLWYLYLPNDPSWCQVDKTQDKQYRRQKLGMMVHTCMLLRKVKRESEVQGEGLEMAQQLKHLLPLQRTQDSFPPLSSGATYPSVPPVWGDPNSLRASMDTACMSYTDTYLGKHKHFF